MFALRKTAVRATALGTKTLPPRTNNVRRYVPQPIGSPGLVASASMHRQVEMIRLEHSGDFRETSMSLVALKEETRLHLREVLQLDKPSASARILPRRHCILVTIGFIRAIIFTDRVYVLTWRSQPAKSYAMSLATHLRQIYGRAASTAAAHSLDPDLENSDDVCLDGSETQQALGRAAQFAQAAPGRPEEAAGLELVVLEHALLTMHGRHARRVSYTRRLLETLLRRVSAVAGEDDGQLYALFPLANLLTHYEMVSRGLCDCVRTLLDDDRDMREACLSEKARLSQQVATAAVDLSRSHATAYDPFIDVGGQHDGAKRQHKGVLPQHGE
jgi:hypothetical protein